VRVGDSSASTSASVNAEGGLLAIATSSLQTFATIPDVTANFEVFATANPQPVATIAVEAEKLGELWGVIDAEGEVWSEVADEGESWTVVSAEGESWTPIAASSDTWTNVSAGNESWSSQ
jgi:hypothetical protein